jgi:hyaluronoglucosaminidase
MTSIEWVGSGDGDALTTLAEQTGLAGTVAPGERLAVEVINTGQPVYDRVHRRRSDEHYRISADPAGRVTIEACSRRGTRWAMVDLDRRRRSDGPPGDISDGPAFGIRGVIEGFYGRPWSEEQRLDMIDFLAAHRFNTFLYAPKDDPFLRDRWREPHAADALRRLRATVDRCHVDDVTAMVGVSPGLSMQYASADDRERLDAKVLGLLDAGVDHVALLFDDIPQHLQHPADREAFRSLAEAHADVANHVADVLNDRTSPLVMCPTVYHGDGDEEYLVTLGSLLDGRVDLFWTGRAICSPAILAAEAVAFARGALRPPLYWDNYPVNDVAMTHEAHLGPYRRRDPLLDRFSVGIMANAMEHAEASKIALATIADYLWAPAAYDPERSWQRALAEAGGPDAPALQCFADTVRGSCLAEPDPVELGHELERFEFELAHSDDEAARARLGEVATRLARAAATLRSPDAFNPRLADELRPWLDKFAVGADVVAVLATVAGRAGSDPQATAELRRLADDLARRPHVVFGTLLEMSIERALAYPCDTHLPTSPEPSRSDPPRSEEEQP